METPNYGFRVVWSEEDKVYIALCPEFEGVSGFGATPEEALIEGKTSLELAVETYLEEGWELPKPIVRRPYSGQFITRTSPSQHALLAQRANDEGVSMNALVNGLISFGLGQTQLLTELKADLVSELKREMISIFAPMILSRQAHATITAPSIGNPSGIHGFSALTAPGKGGNQWPA